MRIAIVVGEYNHEITEPLLDGTLARLAEQGVHANQIKVVKVPGAVEIPLMAQALARTQHYQAIICLGAVVRGDTDHYDFVCQQVSQGCQQVMLTHHLPIIFGILTTNNVAQAYERIGGIHGHKGKEAADAALKMIHLLQPAHLMSESVNEI